MCRCVVSKLLYFIVILPFVFMPFDAGATDEPTSIIKGSADDTIIIGLGNYTIDGGGGEDTIELPLFPNQYHVTETAPDKYTAEFAGYTAVIENVEYVQFGSTFFTKLPLEELASGEAQKKLLELTDIYLAYFGRAPDVIGLEYWQEQYLTKQQPLELITINFAWSEEAQTLYPQGGSNKSFIQTVYQNCFSRNPDIPGWYYWTYLLSGGDPGKDWGAVEWASLIETDVQSVDMGETDLNDRGSFIGNVLLGAYAPTSGEEDRSLLMNKHEVALYYVNKLSVQAEEGFDEAINDLLVKISMEWETRYNAEHVIDYVFENAETLTDVMTDSGLLAALWTHDPVYDIDDDGDNWTEVAGDCNDTVAGINPDAVEICGDGIDQDCNGLDEVCSGETGISFTAELLDTNPTFYYVDAGGAFIEDQSIYTITGSNGTYVLGITGYEFDSQGNVIDTETFQLDAYLQADGTLLVSAPDGPAALELVDVNSNLYWVVSGPGGGETWTEYWYYNKPVEWIDVDHQSTGFTQEDLANKTIYMWKEDAEAYGSVTAYFGSDGTGHGSEGFTETAGYELVNTWFIDDNGLFVIGDESYYRLLERNVDYLTVCWGETAAEALSDYCEEDPEYFYYDYSDAVSVAGSGGAIVPSLEFTQEDIANKTIYNVWHNDDDDYGAITAYFGADGTAHGSEGLKANAGFELNSNWLIDAEGLFRIGSESYYRLLERNADYLIVCWGATAAEVSSVSCEDNLELFFYSYSKALAATGM